MSNKFIERLNEFFGRDIQDFDLSFAESTVWMCGYRHTDWDTGMFKLSYSRVASQCNCSELTAKRTLRSLDEKLLIKRIQQGIGHEPSTYALLDEGELMPQTVAKLKHRQDLIDNAKSVKR